MGQATWAEYFGAICSLAAHPSFPLASFPALLQHEQDLANMTVTWDWAVCRGWSEKVYQMVADGRLKDRWQDMAAIKDVQRDVCTDAVRAMQSHPQPYHVVDSARSLQSSSPATVTSASTTPVNSREDYNKETNGKPCYPSNRGKDCGFLASHGASTEHYLHICAWCAYKFRRQLNHHEQDCLKMKCFLNPIIS